MIFTAKTAQTALVLIAGWRLSAWQFFDPSRDDNSAAAPALKLTPPQIRNVFCAGFSLWGAESQLEGHLGCRGVGLDADCMIPGNVQLGSAHGIPYTMRKFKLSQGGEAAIYATIRMMYALVRGPEGIGHPEVRIAAIEAARGSERGISEVDSVFRWVKRNIEFRGEAAETLQTPRVTLQLRAGDCDDHTILTAALLASLGYRVRFRTVAANSLIPRQFTHVFAEVQEKFSRQWIPLDTTVPRSHPGWEPPMIYRTRSYPALGDGQPQTAGQTILQQLAAPLAQAAASRIAHGTAPEATLNLGLNPGEMQGGVPSWLIYVAVFFVGMWLWPKRGHRH